MVWLPLKILAPGQVTFGDAEDWGSQLLLRDAFQLVTKVEGEWEFGNHLILGVWGRHWDLPVPLPIAFRVGGNS